jgi:hypothetical protein
VAQEWTKGTYDDTHAECARTRYYLANGGDTYEWSIMRVRQGWVCVNDIFRSNREVSVTHPDNVTAGPFPTLRAAKVAYVLGIATGDNPEY